MIGRELPRTRRAACYRALHAFGLIGSIVGLDFLVRSLLNSVRDAGFDLSRVDGWDIAAQVALILQVGSMFWISYLGTRRNLLAPVWLFALVVGLGWVAIILRRLS